MVIEGSRVGETLDDWDDLCRRNKIEGMEDSIMNVIGRNRRNYSFEIAFTFLRTTKNILIYNTLRNRSCSFYVD